MITITKVRAAINVGVMFCFLSIIGFCAMLMFDAALAALIVGATLAAVDYLL